MTKAAEMLLTLNESFRNPFQSQLMFDTEKKGL